MFYRHLVEHFEEIERVLNKGVTLCGVNSTPNNKLFESVEHPAYFKYPKFSPRQDIAKIQSADGFAINCRGPIITRSLADVVIDYEVKFERFAFPAGFMDAFRQKWWPGELHFDGIPPFDKPNLIAPTLKFTTVPRHSCSDIRTPVFVKSAARNIDLRTVIRSIFEFQRDDSMDIFFIFGEGDEEKLTYVPF